MKAKAEPETSEKKIFFVTLNAKCERDVQDEYALTYRFLTKTLPSVL